MTDKTGRPETAGPPRAPEWADIARVLAPAAGCDCQMLAISLAESMRPLDPQDVIASTAPKRRH